eukprot:4595023-Prymnesium_polylepis.1
MARLTYVRDKVRVSACSFLRSLGSWSSHLSPLPTAYCPACIREGHNKWVGSRPGVLPPIKVALSMCVRGDPATRPALSGSQS